MTRLLRARDVAELLDVSPATVLDWWETGKLPGFRLSSRAVRFSEDEILTWLEERRGVTSVTPQGVSCGGPDRDVG
jgi:excisionase family DNA binding protein